MEKADSRRSDETDARWDARWGSCLSHEGASRTHRKKDRLRACNAGNTALPPEPGISWPASCLRSLDSSLAFSGQARDNKFSDRHSLNFKPEWKKSGLWTNRPKKRDPPTTDGWNICCLHLLSEAYEARGYAGKPFNQKVCYSHSNPSIIAVEVVAFVVSTLELVVGAGGCGAAVAY